MRLLCSLHIYMRENWVGGVFFLKPEKVSFILSESKWDKTIRTCTLRHCWYEGTIWSVGSLKVQFEKTHSALGITDASTTWPTWPRWKKWHRITDTPAAERILRKHYKLKLQPETFVFSHFALVLQTPTALILRVYSRGHFGNGIKQQEITIYLLQ